jgi:hypothetical protein
MIARHVLIEHLCGIPPALPGIISMARFIFCDATFRPMFDLFGYFCELFTLVDGLRLKRSRTAYQPQTKEGR